MCCNLHDAISASLFGLFYQTKMTKMLMYMLIMPVDQRYSLTVCHAITSACCFCLLTPYLVPSNFQVSMHHPSFPTRYGFC